VRKTARAQKRQWQALTIRAWVTCNKRALAACLQPVCSSRIQPNDSKCARRRLSAAAPVCLPQCQALFTLARAPLRRARRRHGPSSTHEATLAPVRRDSAGVRNSAKKKIIPRRPREGITRPRNYAVAPWQKATHMNAQVRRQGLRRLQARARPRPRRRRVPLPRDPRACRAKLGRARR
jgi:hypothetical protein